MAVITSIKREIMALGAGPFQEFCDCLLIKMGYEHFVSLGLEAGTTNTTKGTPDSYSRNENGKFILVEYSTVKTRAYKKIKEDLEKCFDTAKTGIKTEDIEKIIYCHRNTNLKPGDIKNLHEFCNKRGVLFEIYGLDDLANKVLNEYPSIAKEYLGLAISTNQIQNVDDFIRNYDANKMMAPLNTEFQYREEELASIISALGENNAVILTGKPGVGKTRLALEAAKTFSKSNEYALLCIRNKGLEIYDDLVKAMEKPGKYLVFIDDANELKGLKHILDYLNLENYTVKLILTVRDYVKDQVISTVTGYIQPYTINILKFSDKEVEGFLKEIFGITNIEYVQQIIHIAEGNPRMAYMAGELAVKEQTLSSISNAAELCNNYYERFLNDSIGNDREMCLAAGILSAVKNVSFDKLSSLKEVLETIDMSESQFRKALQRLSQLEVVEMYENKAARFSDQCFANYMLYYVFYSKKLMPLSEMIKVGYQYNGRAIVEAVNTILNIFYSKNVFEYCKEQILLVWKCFEEKKDSTYLNFVKDFHVFRPEKAIIIAKDMIDRMPNEKIDLGHVRFNRNGYCYESNYLNYLTGFDYQKENLSCALELLMIFCQKNEKALVAGEKWLESSYGIDINSQRNDYLTQQTVSSFLLNQLNSPNDAIETISYQWAKYALDFNFNAPGMWHHNSYTLICNMSLWCTNGLKKLRRDCWRILITLAKKDEWKEKILKFLNDYSRKIREDTDLDVFTYDMEYLEKLLLEVESNQPGYLKILRRILENTEKSDIKLNESWSERFENFEWKIFELLEYNNMGIGDDFDKYEKDREMRLINFGKTITQEELPNFVKTVNMILTDPIIRQEDDYYINSGMDLIAQQFDDEKLCVFVKNYIMYGDQLSVYPIVILERLHNIFDASVLLTKLKESSFPSKNEWLYLFFETLPEEQITVNMVNEFLDYLKDDSDRLIKSSSYRNLKFLENFRKIEPNIYPLACNIIFEKRAYSEFMVNIYLSTLFIEYTAENLKTLFDSNPLLLQNIYFYCLKSQSGFKPKLSYLKVFLGLDDSCLEKFSDYFWDEALHNLTSDHSYDFLWKSEHYVKYVDYLLEHAPRTKYLYWAERFSHVFAVENRNRVVDEHQCLWIKHIIVGNAHSDSIIDIFEFIRELNEDLRRFAVKIFLENNNDLEVFKKIHLFASVQSATNSFIPVYQEEITFLESLFQYMNGIEFLEHREYLQRCIENRKEKIETDRLREFEERL